MTAHPLPTHRGDPMITRLSQLARRRPLTTFFVLTYTLSWALWIPQSIMRDATPQPFGALANGVGSAVPSAVAILLTALTLGKTGTGRLLRQLLIWRIGSPWYLLLLAPTVLVVGAITVVAVVNGGPTARLAVPLGSAVITVLFMTFPGSASGEEIGWRGFALPRLQSVRTALTASLILGTLHALWHLPLWLRGLPDMPPTLYPAFAIQVVALAVIYTWIYNSTGSLLLVVLFHTATNAPLTLVLIPLGIDDYALPYWIMAGVTVLAAIIMVAVYGPANLSRHQRRQQPPIAPRATPQQSPITGARAQHVGPAQHVGQ
jgi:membrane protease YdiL (CAAX protease family)